MRLSEHLPWTFFFDKQYMLCSHSAASQPQNPGLSPFVSILRFLVLETCVVFRSSHHYHENLHPLISSAGFDRLDLSSATLRYKDKLLGESNGDATQ